MTTIMEMVNKRWERGSLEKHIAYYRTTNERLAKYDVSAEHAGVSGAAVCELLLSTFLCNSMPTDSDWSSITAVISGSRVIRFEEVATRLTNENDRLAARASRAPVAAAVSTALYSAGQPGASAESPARDTDRPSCSHCGKRGHRRRGAGRCILTSSPTTLSSDDSAGGSPTVAATRTARRRARSRAGRRASEPPARNATPTTARAATARTTGQAARCSSTMMKPATTQVRRWQCLPRLQLRWLLHLCTQVGRTRS